MEIIDSISDKKDTSLFLSYTHVIQSIGCGTRPRLSSRQKIAENLVTREAISPRIARHSCVTRMIVARQFERYLITYENEMRTNERTQCDDCDDYYPI